MALDTNLGDIFAELLELENADVTREKALKDFLEPGLEGRLSRLEEQLGVVEFHR